MARALRSEADLVVDLSELGFADSSLMLDLAMLARRLRTRGRLVRLRGAQPQIRQLIEIVGLHKLPGIAIDGPAGALI
jgi:anti-anti-sigma regulatory factor